MDRRFASAAELGRLIGAGHIDPVDLTEMFLEAIGAHDPGLAIYARVTSGRARAEAKAARQRAKSGMRRSPLDGIPVSWKDLFDTKGIATEAGSKMLAGRTPKEDAEVLRRATQAGLVCLGKTHMTELAFSGLGINPQTSTPPNKAMQGHCPGGSSSGAAASLTHGLAALAIGSDTGGSVRIPACWNNLTGLKTTYGLLPNDGVVPLCPGFDTVGPLARTVEDAALMLDILAGRAHSPVPKTGLTAFRFFVAETAVFEGCDPEVMAAFEAAIARLAKSGAKIGRGPVDEFAGLFALGAQLFPYEAWAAWGATIEAKGELMFAPVRQRFGLGKNVTETQYRVAAAEMTRLRSQVFSRFGPQDIFLSPAVAILPPKVDALLADHELFTAKNLLALRNTRIVNLLGGAALTLPLPETACGLQLAGGPGSEAALIAAGLAIERIAG